MQKVGPVQSIASFVPSAQSQQAARAAARLIEDAGGRVDELTLPVAVRGGALAMGKRRPARGDLPEVRDVWPGGATLGGEEVDAQHRRSNSRVYPGGVDVDVAELDQAQALAKDRKPNVCRALHLDVMNDAALEQLVATHQLVISLVPASFHARVAAACIIATATPNCCATGMRTTASRRNSTAGPFA